MPKTKDNRQACSKCYWRGVRCAHMTGEKLDTCDIVGKITPETRHQCYLCGFADWGEDHNFHRNGKIPHAPPCE